MASPCVQGLRGRVYGRFVAKERGPGSLHIHDKQQLRNAEGRQAGGQEVTLFSLHVPTSG